MTDMRRLLCPVDFSETSRHALDHALAIANWYEARLTVLHVEHPLVVLEPPILFAERSHSTVSADPEDLRARLRDWLDRAKAPATVEMAVEIGNPTGHILNHAASLEADVIVMGTHGRTGFDRLALGSVAEKILRKAPCPVITVPPPAGATSVLPFKRLLCPVDFSDTSLAALQVAFSMAEESDARLTILHVFEWPADEDAVVENIFKLPEVRRQLEHQTKDRLEALIPPEVRSWCQPTTRMAFGRPYATILDLAVEDRADLIVMGVRGRNALDLTLFGSTTNQVVRRATCPVLTLKPKT